VVVDRMERVGVGMADMTTPGQWKMFLVLRGSGPPCLVERVNKVAPLQMGS